MTGPQQIERRYIGDEKTAMAAFGTDRVQAEAGGWVAIGHKMEPGALVVLYEQRTLPAPWSKPATAGVSWAGIVVVIGGVLAGLGSFLPWVSATAGFVGTVSRNGFDGGGDGIFSAALAIVTALMGIALLARSGSGRVARIGAAVAGVALVGLAGLEIKNVNDLIHSGSSLVVTSVGTGLFVVGFAGAVAIIGALLPDGRSS